MVAFYKHEIASWMDGTASLSGNAYRAYHVICQMIYLNEGPVANNERYLAGACNLSVRSFRVALKELETQGKITNSRGRLTNSRATLELENIETNRQNAAKGGRSSSKRAEGDAKTRETEKLSNEIKVDEQAPLNHGASLIDYTRLEKTREEETRPALPTEAPKPEKLKKEKKEPSSKGAKIDPGWVIPPEFMDYSISKGLTQVETVRNWQKFKNHHESKGTISKSWPASWRTWVANALEFLGRAPRDDPPSTTIIGPKTWTRDRWVQVLKIYSMTNNWYPDWGPPPGDPGCLAPPELTDNQPQLV